MHSSWKLTLSYLHPQAIHERDSSPDSDAVYAAPHRSVQGVSTAAVRIACRPPCARDLIAGGEQSAPGARPHLRGVRCRRWYHRP